MTPDDGLNEHPFRREGRGGTGWRFRPAIRRSPVCAYFRQKSMLQRQIFC